MDQYVSQKTMGRYSSALDREALARAAGSSPTSSTFGNALTFLRRRELIVDVVAGTGGEGVVGCAEPCSWVESDLCSNCDEMAVVTRRASHRSRSAPGSSKRSPVRPRITARARRGGVVR